ncbi:flagellar biosynthetic protein FliO [Nocardioides dubius]|uniref:Flagellar protein FliO/FliZ n=1 Tax=Nocardioides dubius TaxID=317019 RepID=A0ABN1U359_9ACTN
MLELTIRLIASLAIVVGLLLLAAKFFGRQFQSRVGATIQVLHRQALTRSASVAVVVVGPRVLVLGTTDQQVNVLAELDPEELDLEVTEAGVTVLRDDVSDDADLTGDPIHEDLEDPDHPSDPGSPVLGPVDDVRPVGAHRRRARTMLPSGRIRSGRAAREQVEEIPGVVEAKGPLAGSILSPQTWRQAFAAASRRAS